MQYHCHTFLDIIFCLFNLVMTLILNRSRTKSGTVKNHFESTKLNCYFDFVPRSLHIVLTFHFYKVFNAFHLVEIKNM